MSGEVLAITRVGVHSSRSQGASIWQFDVFVVGRTSSDDFPFKNAWMTTSSNSTPPFLTKLDPGGASLQFTNDRRHLNGFGACAKYA